MLGKILLLLSGFLLCLIVYPSSFLYPKDTLPDSNDTRLIAYIISQVQNNILERKNVYEATFFAPEPNTLTYSDLFLTTSLLTLPTRILTDNPILIFNAGFILNFTLTVFTSFLFFHKISKSRLSAVIATLLFNLSGFHLHYYSHLQVFNFWLFFASLLNLLNFLESKNKKYLHFFLFFATLQLAETIFTTYLLFFTSIFFILPELIKRRSDSKNRTEQAHAPSVTREYGFWRASSFLIYPTLWIVLLLPYAKTHFLYEEASRSIRDAAHFSLGLDELFTKYQSWTTIVVLLICSVASKRMRTRSSTSWKNIFWFSLIMSLGPVLKIFGHNLKPLQSFGINWPVPLPYSLFYYFFPGFAGFRTPSRFILLTLFASSALIAIQISKYSNHFQTKTKTFIIFLIFTLLTLESHLPLTGYPANINPPPVYKEAKGLPTNAIILELPIKLWNMPDHQIESIRSLYSLDHKHKRLNGYSGFATYDWIKLVEEINSQGLTPEVLAKIKSRGVTHIVQNNHLSEI